MRWRRILLSSVVGCGFLGGCARDPKLLNREVPQPEVTRLQKADPPRIRPRLNFLDQLPDQPADAVSGEVAARIRATVNGVPIFEEEVLTNAYQVRAALEALPEPERTKQRREVYKNILDGIIDRELLLQDAVTRLKKAGSNVMTKLQDAAEKEFDHRWIKSMKDGNHLKSDDQLKELLRTQGLSLEMIKRQWTRQFIATEYQRNIVQSKLDKIGHEQIQEYYDSHPEEYKVDDAVEWLDLFVGAANSRYKSREEASRTADQIVERLRRGEDFLTLAKQYDDGDSIIRQGAGLGHKHGEIQPPDCEPALFGMKPGEVGILEFPQGYHVFKLIKREFAGKKPCNIEVQKEIRNKLRGAMYEREVKKYIADLKRRAIIEYSRSAQ